MKKTTKYFNFSLVTPAVIRQFVLVFVLVSGLLASLFYLLYYLQTLNITDGIRAQERQIVNLQEHTALASIQTAVTDLTFLGLNNDLRRYLRFEKGSFALKQVSEEYRSLSFARKIYDQIRLLDVKGQELVRVNYNNGRPAIVPDQELQNKSSRYYVKKILGLSNAQIYLSPLDLNMENGQLEQPFKPVIRLGAPVFDDEGVMRGIVILNYLVKGLLNQLRHISMTALGETMLVNDHGYWLLSPHREDEWGFMLKERREKTFISQFPEEWEVIEQQDSGQLLTDHGLFTFSTLSLVDGIDEGWTVKKTEQSMPLTADEADSPYRWKLLSYVSRQVLTQQYVSYLTRLSVFGFFLLLLIAAGSLFIAISLSRRRMHQADLKALAHFDSLTGLPNRALYFDRLNWGQMQANRHESALGQLYIDVDNFKDVNDTLGHYAGDQLLILIAKRILGVVRKSDTVARLGGDEFVVMLMAIKGRQCCEIAARKIMAVMEEPFRFHGVSR